jgi:hypothetical protein
MQLTTKHWTNWRYAAAQYCCDISVAVQAVSEDNSLAAMHTLAQLRAVGSQLLQVYILAAYHDWHSKC